MQQSTTQRAKEQLRAELNAEETSKETYGNEIAHREQIQDSPIWVIGNEERGYFGIIGDHKITETYTTIDEVKEVCVIDNWGTLLTAISVIAEKVVKEVLAKEIMSAVDKNEALEEAVKRGKQNINNPA